MSEISIAQMDKVAVLMALYNASRPMGMGILRAAGQMDIEQAREIMANGSDADYSAHTQVGYFDYLHGRPLKIDLTGDTLRTALYDRDNGEGAARAALVAAGLLVP